MKSYSVLNLLGSKFSAIVYRLVDLIRLLPSRLLRLLRHIGLGMQWKHHAVSSPENHKPSNMAYRMVAWWGESLLYILECVGIGECYETLMDFVKFNSRPLTTAEIALAKTVYGNNIRYKRVRVDEYALIGPRQMRMCYVSFYTINNWRGMADSTLIHELMHIWQYKQIGAVYMPRALRAQYSQMGYNYGGVEALKAYLLKGLDIRSFNLEQQADIVEDYFRISRNLKPCWGTGGPKDLWLYRKILGPIWQD